MKLGGPKIRISRRLGIPITPKSAKYLERRPYPPGQHGPTKRTKKMSGFEMQLLEKQKLRAQYNISEKQMRICFAKSQQKKGSTVDNIIQYLETRIDAIILRGGFARTIFAARQYVSHRHVLVNDKPVNIASYRAKINDKISIREKSRTVPVFAEAANGKESVQVPGYLEVDRKNFSIVLKALPKREDVPVICNVQSVVEYYSR